LKPSAVDSKTFQTILTRNIALPLVLTVLLSAVFAGLLFYLMDSNRELLQSAQVIARENDGLRMIIDSETGLRGYLLTGEKEYLKPRTRANRALPDHLAKLGELLSSYPVQLATLEKTKRDYLEWVAEGNRAIRIRASAKASATARTELRKDLMDQIREDFESLRSATERVRDDHADRVARTTQFTLFSTVLVAILFGAALAFAGRRQLLALSSRYEEILEEQSQQTAELERQAWLRIGQAKLAERVRGDANVAGVAKGILDFVADYVGAKLGALFLVGEKGFLSRSASLALSDDAPVEFGTGEGLVGKVAETPELVVIEDVPEDYSKLTSALGATRPTHLVLVPLVSEGEVRGVLELGFLGRPGADPLELLTQISEMAGVALRSATYRTRLQDLLHESQQLAEELQTQQEELRVSNEELSERSQSLIESTGRLESQQRELEQTNEQLEEQAQILESQRKDLDERNSALENASESLKEKAEQLEAASRYKSEFLANMSHELRTPLNSSLILAKLLQDNPTGNLTEEQVHFAATIYAAGNDLLALINDILDLSKVEAGKLELHPERVSPEKVGRAMESFFRPMAESKGLTFEVAIGESLPILTTDRQRLDQILRNLLANAIKFTAKGSVKLLVEKSGNDGVTFVVRDTGIGIDPAQHDLIFEAFHQADGTISRKFGGTGLGLSISQNLAELLGGKIQVESAVGAGATFSIRLPVGLPAGGPAPTKLLSGQRSASGKAVAGDGSSAREAPQKAEGIPSAEQAFGFADDRARVKSRRNRVLLVVEDEPDFAKILFDLGHELDFKVLLAGNATDGYALATHYLPSAIILDVRLPDTSGLSLLDRLKENPKTRHIPVHGMSVGDYSREALHLGAIGFLMKPADRDELKETLKRLEEKNAQRLKRVLIVEDDDRQRVSIEKLIGEKGVEIRSVGTGEEALHALRETTFDCMIMDLKLPDMSGFRLLEKMTESEERAFPPVIVYTGHDLTRAEEERLRRYSRSIIIKGARSPERLLDEVTLFLHQVESKLSPENQKLLQASRNREKAFEGRTILVVDDDIRNIFALTSALENKGATVIVARNGRESIEKISASEESGRRPDLVLMDIMMPEMDGYEAIGRIRSEKRFADLPIIAVTAKAMRDDYEKCLSVGANDYLAKPVDLDRLISLMRVWLPKQVGRI
jgi:signal transduction histidine kinase/CheY-like chemotaxis protein/CHASE3 domain sensor protein